MKKEKKIDKSVIFNIMAIILIIIFCFAISPVTLQNDTYYTIKIGEHIMQNGIDMKDPFSWHEDLDYTYPHWLYDVITYLIYSAFGMVGIYLTTCILACILGVTIYRVNCKLVKNNLISFMVTIGAMYLLKGYIAARAQLVTFILFILTIYFIERFLKNKKKRYAIGLIIIPILIANLHLAVWPFYFILYMPYIGEYIIAILSDTIIFSKLKEKRLRHEIEKLTKIGQDEEKVKKSKKNIKELLDKKQKELQELIENNKKVAERRKSQKPYKIIIKKNNNIKWLIVIMIICVFTGLLTPLGTTPYTYLVKTMQGNTTQHINEHLPMTLANQTEVLCTLILFLAILIFTKTKIRLNDLFMIGGLAFLMLVSRRQLSMFTLMGSVVLNRLLTYMFSIYDKQGIKRTEKMVATGFGIFVSTAVILILSLYFAKDKFDDKIVNESSYPVAACDYIIENIDYKNARFYNEYNYGSYLLFRGIPVFIDSRADLYAPEFSKKEDDIFMDFMNVSSINTYYEDMFEKYNTTHLIMYKKAKINMLITESGDENYKELYSDDNFIVYERLNAK